MSTPALARLKAAIERAELSILKPLWKGDVVGTPFIDADTVSPNFGDRVMYTCVSGETINHNLPVAGAADAGKRIGFHDTTFAAKDIGDIIFSPQAGQKVGGHPAGQQRKLQSGTIGPWLELEWDGNDTWNVVAGLFQSSSFDAFDGLA